MYTVKSLIFGHFRPIFGSFWVSMGSLKASQGPLSFSKTVFQHTKIVSLPKILKIGCLQNISPKNQLFWAFQLHFGQFLDIYGAPTGQLRGPFSFNDGISTYNHIFLTKNLENWMFIGYIPQKSPILGRFQPYKGPLHASRGPPIFSKTVFQHTIIFSLKKMPKIRR